MKKQILLMLVLVFVMVGMSVAGEPIGVFANSNTNCIRFIDPLTQTVSPPWLSPQLGNLGSGLFDVEITSDGKTAIVSNFGDSKIFFIDISGGLSAQPTLLGWTNVGFFAEDMALTPDDKYVLVTDGSESKMIAVIDVATHTVACIKNSLTKNSESVTVSPDGKTVLTTDYENRKVHMWSLVAATPPVSLAHITSKDIAPVRPVNVTISPDGKTAIVVNANGPRAPFFRIIPGDLQYKGVVWLRRGQSCVFSRDGSKAYYLSNPFLTWVYVLNVTGPGQVSYSNTSIQVFPHRGTSQLYGVDTMAIDPSGNYLYVTNPTLSGGVPLVSIINLQTNTWEKNLNANGIPTGIAFATIE